MKAQLKYQAERLKVEVEKLQQQLRHTRLALFTILQDIEEAPEVENRDAQIDKKEVVG